MSEGVEVNYQKENDTVKLEITKLLTDLHQQGKIDQERFQRQQEIIRNLPNDFYMNIKAIPHLPNVDPKNLGGLIAGYTFEELTRADKNICPNEESILGAKLRGILNNPDVFNLDFYGGKNPDLAMVKTKEGKLVVFGWVEAKSGHLDFRAYRQLTSFENSFMDLIDFINAKKVNDLQYLKDHGLAEIADNHDKITLVDEPQKILAVPFGAFEQNIDKLFGDNLSREQKRTLQEVLTGDEENSEDKYLIRESPFSRSNLYEITILLIEKLER